VLPPRIKNMVRALVLVRKRKDAEPVEASNPKPKRSDLVRGKGGGLIMLLHGGPGTGKTLTAGMQPSPTTIMVMTNSAQRGKEKDALSPTTLNIEQGWS